MKGALVTTWKNNLEQMHEITGTTEYSDKIRNNGNYECCQHISFIERLRFDQVLVITRNVDDD